MSQHVANEQPATASVRAGSTHHCFEVHGWLFRDDVEKLAGRGMRDLEDE
eukprot:CAMPEP_0170402524 /NCGR_PEP_ID=MMETSP0117_2-20130122/25608_1 /TAXON_ID=400756 /ORGANISM="Durinskia baltica, Strain CSIRO CS-38" /LENGTH=49 /DNA_ID= /DNA_START= /DNA_END= /DNA_ORIENTATION=